MTEIFEATETTQLIGSAGIDTHRERLPMRRPIPPTPPGALRVSLTDIEAEDMRFQCRLSPFSDDLVQSIEEHGQHNPVILWGKAPPYIIIDGFRRVETMKRLGFESVLAVLENDLEEDRAFAIAFSLNARRKALSPYDKANAIYQATHEMHLSKAEVASMLGMSARQVDRYLGLLSLSEPIYRALTARSISMAHAVALARANPEQVEGWIEEIVHSKIPAAELSKRLRTHVVRQPRSYFAREGTGFRLQRIRYRASMTHAEKRAIWDSLEIALKIMAESS